MATKSSSVWLAGCKCISVSAVSPQWLNPRSCPAAARAGCRRSVRSSRPASHPCGEAECQIPHSTGHPLTKPSRSCWGVGGTQVEGPQWTLSVHELWQIEALVNTMSYHAEWIDRAGTHPPRQVDIAPPAPHHCSGPVDIECTQRYSSHCPQCARLEEGR